MPKVSMVDDIFSPDDKITLNYAGSNPFRVCQIIRPLFEKVMQVEGKDTFERIFKWDITEDPRSFYNMWTVLKEEDRWTKVIGKAVIQGKQHTKTKSGNVRIEISGYVETTYDYNNFLQRIFWAIYNNFFYHKRRRQYMERGKEYLLTVSNEISKELKIPKE